MKERIFDIKIDENINIVIDSRFKIKGFIQFIRLSFNKLEIKDEFYKIYYDEKNIKNHKLLINSIANFYKKYTNDEVSYKKLLLNYKKDIIIQIKKHQLSFDENAVYIKLNKLSNKEFEILFANAKKSVFNYVKGLFLLELLDLRSDRLVVSFTEETKKIINALVSKNSIMGYKVVFSFDESEFDYIRQFSVEGSIKEYLIKIRNALELFGVEDIYQFEKIKKEYKRLAKKYHPDLHRNKPELIQKIYDKKFRRVKESYELLEEYYKSKGLNKHENICN